MLRERQCETGAIRLAGLHSSQEKGAATVCIFLKRVTDMECSWIALMLMLFTLPTQAAVQMYYLHNDHLGTPRVVTNQQKAVVWKGQLKPFGETKVEVEAITNHRRFPGQRFDIESRLYYNYFRDYDPTTGRYIQSDPIGLGGGENTYAYVLGNPVKLHDRLGLDITICRWGGSLPHIGYGVNTNQTFGKRVRADASSLKFLVPLGVTVPGEVSSDHMNDATQCKTISTTKEQDEKANQFLKNSRTNYQEYNLYNQSCVDFVRDSLSDVLKTPYSQTNMPSTLYNQIK
jgi:RHS repeat-associated protein